MLHRQAGAVQVLLALTSLVVYLTHLSPDRDEGPQTRYYMAVIISAIITAFEVGYLTRLSLSLSLSLYHSG